MRSELRSTLTKFQGREERVRGQQVKPGGVRQGRMERRSAGERVSPRRRSPRETPKLGLFCTNLKANGIRPNKSSEARGPATPWKECEPAQLQGWWETIPHFSLWPTVQRHILDEVETLNPRQPG